MAFIPGPALLDFLSHLLHTTFITDGRQLQMNQRYVDELRQKYIKNPPEGMTPKLVRNMTDSDLLDMHYFLTEDDDLDDDGWEEGSISTCSKSPSVFYTLLWQNH